MEMYGHVLETSKHQPEHLRKQHDGWLPDWPCSDTAASATKPQRTRLAMPVRNCGSWAEGAQPKELRKQQDCYSGYSEHKYVYIYTRIDQT